MTIADLFEKGLPIYPQSGKKPVFKGWQEMAEKAGLDDLRRWWRQGYREWGIYLRPTGLVVVDCDDEEATQWMGITLPDTPWKTRTRRGEHRYYRVPSGFDLKEGRISKLFAVDLKHKAGITAPTSVRDGFVYTPEGDWSAPKDKLPFLPRLEVFRAPAPWEGLQPRPKNIPLCPMIDDKIKAYIARCDESRQGANGSYECKKAAAYLVNGLGLSVEDALPWMEIWNHEKALPEWSTKELLHALQTATREGPRMGRQVGWALTPGPRALI